MLNIIPNQGKYKFLTTVLFLFIAITLGLNNIVVGVKVFGVSIDKLFGLFCFLLLSKSFFHDFKYNKYFRKINMIFVGFLLLKILKTESLLLQNESMESGLILMDMAKNIFFIMYFYLAYFLSTRYVDGYKIIILVLFLGFVLAFFQHPLTPLTSETMDFKLEYFSGNLLKGGSEKLEDAINYGYEVTRVSGPYGYSITLSYVLITAAIITIRLYLKENSLKYIALFIFIFFISLLSLTRSVILSMLILSFYLIYYFLKGRGSSITKVLVLLLLSFFSVTLLSYFIIGNDPFMRVFSFNDSSANARLPLLLTGIIAVIENPLGVPTAAYMEVKDLMYMTYQNHHILTKTSHNGIINIGFEYTFLGYFLFAFFIMETRSHLIGIDKVKRTFWLCALFSYFTHVMFHNEMMFISDYHSLLFLALLASETNNGKKELCRI
tara:strand:- start:951 stop:2261 length:1311 start_codon:yes stop_codon:yes gene_type:complete